MKGKRTKHKERMNKTRKITNTAKGKEVRRKRENN